jgi:hypothetical protein
MSLESTLARARERAGSVLMTSTCKVAHQDGPSTTGGLKRAGWTVDHAAAPVRIEGANTGSSPSRDLDLDGLSVTVPVRVARFAWDIDNLGTNSVFEVTSGDCAGEFFRVVEASPKDHASSRRVAVVGIDRPEGWS